MGETWSQGTAGSRYCGQCGAPLAPDAVVCGRCGRPVVGPLTPGEAGQLSAQWPASPPSGPGANVYGGPQHLPSDPWPGSMEPAGGEQPAGAPAPAWPAPGTAWSSTFPAAPAGMAALAATPVALPPARARGRWGLIAGVAAICLIALLGGGIYWVYAAFLSPANQIVSAHDLPADTIYFTSVDLVAAASHAQQVNTSHTGQQNSTSDLLKQATGLDWQSDVVPWLGRTETFALFPARAGANSTDKASSPVSYVALLDSRDDAAAQRAIQKALAFQQQHGNPFASMSYGGYALYVSQSGSTPTIPLGAFALGNGRVILASSADAARTVIDRIDGRGTTLADTPAFQQVVASLPSDRFATVYLNLRPVESLFNPDSGVQSIPFLDTYPTGGGYVGWTNIGVRTQVTFRPAHGGVPQGTLGGDTTSLAGLAPADATVYAGVANLGQLVGNSTDLLQPAKGPTDDPLQATFGIPETDPALTQPAAVVLLPSAAGQPFASAASALLIREPNTASAQSVLMRLARHEHWTARSTSVDGLPATAFYSSSSAPGWLTPSAGSAPGVPSTLVAIGSLVSGILVLASTRAALSTVIGVAQGSQSSLSQTSKFQQLVSRAPAGAAATVYANLASLGQGVGAGVTGTASGGATQPQALASLFTLVWNDSELQTTSDTALSQ